MRMFRKVGARISRAFAPIGTDTGEVDYKSPYHYIGGTAYRIDRKARGKAVAKARKKVRQMHAFGLGTPSKALLERAKLGRIAA